MAAEPAGVDHRFGVQLVGEPPDPPRGGSGFIVAERVDGSDGLSKTKRAELRGRLPEKPGLNRYLRVTAAELDRIQLVTLATCEGTVAQRSMLRRRQRLDEPPRYYDFAPTGD